MRSTAGRAFQRAAIAAVLVFVPSQFSGAAKAAPAAGSSLPPGSAGGSSLLASASSQRHAVNVAVSNTSQWRSGEPELAQDPLDPETLVTAYPIANATYANPLSLFAY